MDTTVLRFKYSTTNYDFKDDEAVEMIVEHVCRATLYKNNFNYHGIIKSGYPYKIFTVKFNLIRNSVMTNLTALYGLETSTLQPEPIQMFYEYLLTPSLSAYVKMMRQDFKKTYSQGYQKMGYILPIRFIETPNPGNVAVIQRVIGV